jgi:hypothetical protein
VVLSALLENLEQTPDRAAPEARSGANRKRASPIASERAVKLRELLKNRAATFEMIDELDRAEADYNALVDGDRASAPMIRPRIVVALRLHV